MTDPSKPLTPVNPTTLSLFGRLKAYLRNGYDRFLKIRGNPKEISSGLALGLFVGMTPTMGIQMPIAILLAALFKWNKISAAGGVWITNPVTAPFIYGLCYITGRKCLGFSSGFHLSASLDLNSLATLIRRAPEVLWTLTVGGIVLGVPIAVIGYYASFFILVRYREKIGRAVAKEKELLIQTREKIKKKIKSRKKKRR